ncbi:flagellar biosynthesis protein FliQ [Schnuerera sp. xch1]|uniref:flagellar biosynthesis protein FliQ n=1 Tax=Schnuerera sp. xch1 TaxID=2874283 RepID=UPI001CBE237B|nr:flagellar biosynthesis protein FliQ [Schnuerera sp. xch1]MBZ2173860.1 flagellar biosynthesis protein FliQ [Schnuerera sp. xch1]
MNQGDIITLAQDAIKTVLMISAPMLIFSLVVGLIVSIIQAVTQIQEATLAFVPKIIAVLLSLVIFGPWILQVITEFTTNLITNVSLYIR